MISIFGIVKSNAATFYNYRTNQPEALWPRYTAILATSAALSLVFGKFHDELYGGLISVQSILVGFAFNVLFYLSSNPITLPAHRESLEAASKSKKLRKLADEIFYNISYFNLVAIFSIALSCLALLVNAYSLDSPTIILGEMPEKLEKVTHIVKKVAPILGQVLVWMTFASAGESLLTFVRIIKRMTYLFKERISLEGGRER